MKKRKEFCRFACGGEERKQTEDGKTLVANSSFGCDLRGGKLRCGVGARRLHLPSGDIKFERADVAHVTYIPDCYEKDKDGWAVAYYDGTVQLHMPQEKLEFNGYQDVRVVAVPTGAGVNVPVLQGKAGLVRLNRDGSIERIAETACGKAACYFRDRFFYLSAPETIRYSAPTQPFSFADSADDSGEICLVDGGDVLRLLPMKDAIYVIKENAILRFVAVGAARDFRVETVGYGGGTIVGESVAALNGAILFVAKDGVYRFDGSKCARLTGFPREAYGDYFGVSDGCNYYLSYATEADVNTWVLNADGEGYYLPRLRVLGEIGGEIVAIYGDEALALSGGEEDCLGLGIFTFNAYLPLGNGEEKTVTGVSVYGVGDVEIEVKSERKNEKRRVAMVGGVGGARLAVKGKEFFCVLRLSPKTCVEKIAFAYQTLEGSV